MAGTVNFASPNYHESQPYALEGPLAETVATNPAAAGVALPLLLGYMSERSGQQDQYRQELNQQHQYASQALGENQANNARERIIDSLKLTNPGAIGALASNPITGPLFAGTDPTQLQGMSDFNNRMGQAGIVEKTGRGVGAEMMAGAQPDLNAVGRLTGLPTAQGTAPMVQAAQVNAAGRLAAANAGAGGIHLSQTSLPDANGQTTSLSTKTTLPNVANLTEQLKAALPRVGQTTDNGSQAASNTDPQVIQMQKSAIPYIERDLKASNPAAYSDVKAGMMKNGGMPLVGKVNGQYHIIGASGQVH